MDPEQLLTVLSLLSVLWSLCPVPLRPRPRDVGIHFCWSSTRGPQFKITNSHQKAWCKAMWNVEMSCILMRKSTTFSKVAIIPAKNMEKLGSFGRLRLLVMYSIKYRIRTCVTCLYNIKTEPSVNMGVTGDFGLGVQNPSFPETKLWAGDRILN